MIAMDTASATLATIPAPATTAWPGAAARRARARSHRVEPRPGSGRSTRGVIPGRSRTAPTTNSSTAR